MSTLKQKTIGKATVIVDIVDKGNFEIRPEYSMNPSQIAVHNTGNSGRGANAKAHNTYIHNMSELPASATGFASWHFSVDDKFIYQHIPLDESAWHTGDGNGLTSGNRTAIAIEICENVDMENYAQAEENAIALIVELLKMFPKIPLSKVKPHQAFSGKFCPRVILGRDGSFLPFAKRIKDAVEGKKAPESDVAGVSTSKPSTSSKPKPSTGAVGGRLEAQKGKVVNFYSKPTFNKDYKVGEISGSIGFPKVVKEVSVEGGKMYHVRNSRNISYYITSRADLVNVIGGTKPAPKPVAKPKPKPVPKPSIKSVGKVKVANLNNYTYVYEKTNDGSKRIEKAHKGSVYNISGSVKGWYEVIVNGKRAYIKSKYCQRV